MAVMQSLVLFAASASQASGALLRSTGAHPPLRPATPAGRCAERKGVQFLAVDAANVEEGIFQDGFSRVACEVDASPASVRINFKEHACGNVSSCRLLEIPMQPRMCFDFCRTQASAKFFGLVHGRDCYCTTYFHAQSVGGQGVCDAPCEGDTKEMCGGMEKSSLFEMHMCADSADEAIMAQNASAEALAEASTVASQADTTVAQVRGLAGTYKLDVCSVAPEGQRVCAVRQQWLSLAVDVATGASDLTHAVDVLNQSSVELVAHQAGVQPAANATAEAASGLELTTDTVLREAVAVRGKAGMTTMALTRVAGPLAQENVAKLTAEQRQQFQEVFKPLAHEDNTWSGICALGQIPGESYTALGQEDDWLACAQRCIRLSTGTGQCVAFNFQYWVGTNSTTGGLAACQLLQEEGLVEPSIAKAVPVFEVAEQTKTQVLGLTKLGCYAKSGWMAGHPRGPLGTHVVRTISI